MKFKHKNGGIAEVYTADGINRLRSDKNYSEIPQNVSEKVIHKEVPFEDKKIEKKLEKVEEVVKDKPLQ